MNVHLLLGYFCVSVLLNLVLLVLLVVKFERRFERRVVKMSKSSEDLVKLILNLPFVGEKAGENLLEILKGLDGSVCNFSSLGAEIVQAAKRRVLEGGNKEEVLWAFKVLKVFSERWGTDETRLIAACYDLLWQRKDSLVPVREGSVDWIL